jgi:hypothetical protein
MYKIKLGGDWHIIDELSCVNDIPIRENKIVFPNIVYSFTVNFTPELVQFLNELFSSENTNG